MEHTVETLSFLCTQQQGQSLKAMGNIKKVPKGQLEREWLGAEKGVLFCGNIGCSKQLSEQTLSIAAAELPHPGIRCVMISHGSLYAAESTQTSTTCPIPLAAPSASCITSERKCILRCQGGKLICRDQLHTRLSRNYGLVELRDQGTLYSDPHSQASHPSMPFEYVRVLSPKPRPRLGEQFSGIKSVSLYNQQELLLGKEGDLYR